MSYSVMYKEGGLIDCEIDTIEEAEAIANEELPSARRMNTTIVVVEEDDGIGRDDMWNPADDCDYPEYQGV